MLIQSVINELYELYGFTKEPSIPGFEDKIAIYMFDQGYFHNVEIVVYEEINTSFIEKIKTDYIQAGYSVSIKEESTTEELKQQLFTGFFKIDSSNQRVIADYNHFCTLQTHKNGGVAYSYIASHYTIDNGRNDIDIVENIYSTMTGNGAQLVILEAPAGFGKTCTSYEVSKKFATDGHNTIPILAELSKNRTAKIFDYVLFSEIDSKFSQLSKKLVTSQIIAGNIPLIIDGFDELLSKTSLDRGDNADDAKSMLDTVAAMLGNGSQAKILLTARKSSVFVGDAFNNWINGKLDTCGLTRIQILSPTIDDWIGHDKQNALKKAGVELESITNPVLLSMLRNTNLSEYNKSFQNTGDVLEYYIKTILSREIERQQLLIDWAEQRDILRKLAAALVQLDITSDEPDAIKALIEDIVSCKLNNYVDAYDVQTEYTKPTEEEFLMKLVHNALLDRVKIGSNNIGFINEFFLGIFVGEAVINQYIPITDVKGYFLSATISSFASERSANIYSLLEELHKCENELSTEHKLLIESILTHSMSFDYVDEYIANVSFDVNWSCTTNIRHYFYNCIFSNCIFSRTVLATDIFEGCHFINCTFYDIVIDSSNTPIETSAFISCKGHEALAQIIGENHLIESDIVQDTTLAYDRRVLEQYWHPGAKQAELYKTEKTLYRGFDQTERQHVGAAIERLISKGILQSYRNSLMLNISKIKEVSEILER